MQDTTMRTLCLPILAVAALLSGCAHKPSDVTYLPTSAIKQVQQYEESRTELTDHTASAVATAATSHAAGNAKATSDMLSIAGDALPDPTADTLKRYEEAVDSEESLEELRVEVRTLKASRDALREEALKAEASAKATLESQAETSRISAESTARIKEDTARLFNYVGAGIMVIGIVGLFTIFSSQGVFVTLIGGGVAAFGLMTATVDQRIINIVSVVAAALLLLAVAAVFIKGVKHDPKQPLFKFPFRRKPK